MSAHTVRQVQERLIEDEYDVGPDGADNKGGSDTAKAIRLYQAEHDLPVNGNIRDSRFLDALFSHQPKAEKMNSILGGILSGLLGNLLNWQLIQGYLRSALIGLGTWIGLDGFVGHDGSTTIIGALMTIAGVVVQAIANNTKAKALAVVKAVDAHPGITVIPANQNLTGKPIVSVNTPVTGMKASG